MNPSNAKHLDTFMKWLSGGHSPATVASYKYAFYAFQKWLTAIEKDFEDFTLDDLLEYQAFLERMSLKNSTRNHYTTALRSFWDWMYRQKIVKLEATMIPSPKRNDSQSYDYLTEEEYKRILSLYNEFFPVEMRNKCIVAMLYSTGVRLGELIDMDITSIDTKTCKGLVKTFKRDNHWRDVYWSEECNDLLKRWLQVRQVVLEKHKVVSSALFISMNSSEYGGRIERHAIQRIFRHARFTLNMKRKITPHSCRHGFGARAVKNNANIRLLQAMMGHSKLSTTEIYMGYSNKDVEAEYRKLMGVGA